MARQDRVLTNLGMIRTNPAIPLAFGGLKVAPVRFLGKQILVANLMRPERLWWSQSIRHFSEILDLDVGGLRGAQDPSS